VIGVDMSEFVHPSAADHPWAAGLPVLGGGVAAGAGETTDAVPEGV
jgi:hypothetical protein